MSFAPVVALLACGFPMAQTTSPTDLSALCLEFAADEGSLFRLHELDLSTARRDRLKAFYQTWKTRVAKTKAESQDAKVDAFLLDNLLNKKIRQLDLDAIKQDQPKDLVPFLQTILDLEEARRKLDRPDPQKSAETLANLTKMVNELKPQLGEKLKASKTVANQAARQVRELQQYLRDWFRFYNGYDPLFTWWTKEPYQALDKSLGEYADAIKEKLAGVKPGDDQAIVGNPIGRDALMAELQFELIPYTPEELIQIAEREYAWCEKEAKRAAKDLGFKDDWRKALEHVKNLYVAPGDQPKIIQDMAIEAIKFVEDRDLVTVPPLAKETWRMGMMSPERQKVSPFFLGGEQILVSYPTDGMPHDLKLMSMRGNNPHFSRATVQHELIPGHHLQGFMLSRYRPYREIFGTPFWIEGWALYWEMLLWDQNFPRGAEDRVGMLFWRMHRCARIIFSLKFHLGEMTPEECIDFLVEKVGHERANAEGEVRRSFSGDYPPLYQLAYMIGGLQIRALETELVKSKKMTYKQFHDAILHQNQMPIEILRLVLQGKSPDLGYRSIWRFAG